MIGRREKLSPAGSYARLPRREEDCFPAGSSSRRKGFIPVLVGRYNNKELEEEMERVEIPIKLINHPSLVSLLDVSVQVFGCYNPHGVLKVSCDPQSFKEMVRTLLISTKK